jgi:hypothetical protein
LTTAPPFPAPPRLPVPPVSPAPPPLPARVPPLPAVCVPAVPPVPPVPPDVLVPALVVPALPPAFGAEPPLLECAPPDPGSSVDCNAHDSAVSVGSASKPSERKSVRLMSFRSTIDAASARDERPTRTKNDVNARDSRADSRSQTVRLSYSSPRAVSVLPFSPGSTLITLQSLGFRH